MTITRNDFARLNDFDLLCALAAGEAADQPAEGRIAVVYVVLNRVLYTWEGRASFGATIKKVALRRRQFSCFDDERRYDDMMEAASPCTKHKWAQELRGQVWQALNGRVPDASCAADHYFAPALVLPTWAAKMRKVATVGAHDFYCSLPEPSANSLSTASADR